MRYETSLHRLAAVLLALALSACETPPAAPADISLPPPPPGEVIAIGRVQGGAGRSPLEGHEVTVEGIVSANFARHLGGWFVQDEGDGDAGTSDALFVLADDRYPLRRGDRIRVRGTVLEHGQDDAMLTALQALDIEPLGRGLVPPVILDAPPESWEALEGMLIRIDAPLTLSGHHELARYGSLIASFDGRLRTPTEIAAPGDAARAVAARNAARSLWLDDARNTANPDTVWYLPDDRQSPRSGSVFTGVEGILDQRHGQYRLQLTGTPALEASPRPPAPAVAGDIRIASLNLENLFNGDGRGGGFPTARGARTVQGYQAQLDRLVATVDALAPDILAVMELENDGHGPDSSIAQFAEALNHAGGDWRFIDAGDGPGDDVIRVGLLYRASKVTPAGAAATLETGPFGERSRVPLAQGFRAGEGPAFVIAVNHFKSKGCSEARGSNTDQDDGQSCWNPLRVDSARRLADWLATDPTGSGTDLALIVGDLNAYAMEDPVQTLIRAGWHDALAGIERPYTYVFQGQAGRLDHVLASASLLERVVDAAIWHSNADEPTSVRNDPRNTASPWRSSDHDPIVIGLRLH